ARGVGNPCDVAAVDVHREDVAVCRENDFRSVRRPVETVTCDVTHLRRIAAVGVDRPDAYTFTRVIPVAANRVAESNARPERQPDGPPIIINKTSGRVLGRGDLCASGAVGIQNLDTAAAGNSQFRTVRRPRWGHTRAYKPPVAAV